MKDHIKQRVYEFADKLIILFYRETKGDTKGESSELIIMLRRSMISVQSSIVFGSTHEKQEEYKQSQEISCGVKSKLLYFPAFKIPLNYIKEPGNNKPVLKFHKI
jgi:hypothetical protein